MSFNYFIAGVKENKEGDDSLSFAVCLKDTPEYEGCLFMYDNLQFVEDGDQVSIQVGFSFIEPGGARQRQQDMKPEMVQLMSDLISQVSEEILTNRMQEMKNEQGQNA